MNDKFNYVPKKIITNKSVHFLLNEEDIKNPYAIDIKTNENFCMYQDYVKEKMDQMDKETNNRDIIELFSYRFHLEKEIERLNNLYKTMETVVEKRKAYNLNDFNHMVGLLDSDYGHCSIKDTKNKETHLPK